MATVKINEMKGSEIHRIVAAVLETMEKAGFPSSVDVTLNEAKEPERWKMIFQKGSSTLEELNVIKTELGENFQVKISPKDKQMLMIEVEAPQDDFIRLLERSFTPYKGVTVGKES